MLGDTNCDPTLDSFKKDTSFAPLMASGFKDTWDGVPAADRPTCPTRKGIKEVELPSATFDRAFVSKDLQAEPWAVSGTAHCLQEGTDTNNAAALPGTGGMHTSDHYPVYIDVVR